jgi:hypothetical protein
LFFGYPFKITFLVRSWEREWEWGKGDWRFIRNQDSNYHLFIYKFSIFSCGCAVLVGLDYNDAITFIRLLAHHIYRSRRVFCMNVDERNAIFFLKKKWKPNWYWREIICNLWTPFLWGRRIYSRNIEELLLKIFMK